MAASSLTGTWRRTRRTTSPTASTWSSTAAGPSCSHGDLPQHPPREELRAAATGGDAVRSRDRRLDRERRAAVDRAGAALLADRSFVGRERLRADLRRLPDARRPDGRPARTQADVAARARAGLICRA